MKTEPKAFHIDRDFVLSHDVGDVMDPVRLRANFYEGPAEYEASLSAFSREQSWLFAIYWYDAEVNNGGHDQFYFNSTGLVWADAPDGTQEALHGPWPQSDSSDLRRTAPHTGVRMDRPFPLPGGQSLPNGGCGHSPFLPSADCLAPSASCLLPPALSLHAA